MSSTTNTMDIVQLSNEIEIERDLRELKFLLEGNEHRIIIEHVRSHFPYEKECFLCLYILEKFKHAPIPSTCSAEEIADCLDLRRRDCWNIRDPRVRENIIFYFLDSPFSAYIKCPPHTGPRGGKYRFMKGKKVYLKYIQ